VFFLLNFVNFRKQLVTRRMQLDLPDLPDGHVNKVKTRGDPVSFYSYGRKRRTLVHQLLVVDHLSIIFCVACLLFPLQPAAFSLVLQGVEGWPLHRGVLQRIKAHGNHLDFSVTVSFFHFPTRSFFGSTWQSGAGAAQKEGGKGDESFRAYGVTLNEVVNWYTYIDDPRTCVLVELVATETNPELNIAVDSFACGWTVLQPSPFGRRGIPSVDSREEGESSDQLLARGAYLTARVFKGTPRSLLAADSKASLDEVLASLEEENSSTSAAAVLRYQLVTHHALLKARSLFAENELVGSSDVVPGLQLRRAAGEKHRRIAAFGHSVVDTASGGTVSKSRKKLRRRKARLDDDDDDSAGGDSEDLASAVAVARGVHLQPTLELEVSKPLVRVQDCAEMEVALRRSFDWSLERDERPLEALKRIYPKRPMATAAEKDAALSLVRLSEPQTIRFQVLERRLRFVVHNSRQVVDGAVIRLGERDRTTSESEGNQAPATELFAIKGKDSAKAQEDRHASVTLKGFSRHKQMALVAFLEYVVRPEQNGLRVPLPAGSSGDLTAIFPDPGDRDDYLTRHAARATIVVGAAHFLPFDGKLLRLRGTSDGRALNSPCDEKSGRFTLALQVDEATRMLATQLPEKPLVWPLPGSDDLFDGQRMEDPDKPLRLVKFKCEAREAYRSSSRSSGENASGQAAVADETPSDPANESDGDDDGSGGEEKEGDDDDNESSSASEISHSGAESESSHGSATKKKKKSSRRRDRHRYRSPTEKSPRRSTTRPEEKEEPASSPSSLDTAPSPAPSPRPRYHRTQPAVSFDATRGRDDDLADALMMHSNRGGLASADPSSLFAHTLSAPILAETSTSARNQTFVARPGQASTFGAALLTNGRTAGGGSGHRSQSIEGPTENRMPYGGGGAIPFGDSQAENHFHASSGQQLSRASRARLGASSQWGGPLPQEQTGDLSGTAADTLSADVSVEMSDPRCRSVLTLRFAAYRAPDRGSALPAAISISYRFFDRPPVRSGRMTLKLDVAQARGAVSNATPRLLVVESGNNGGAGARMHSRDEVGLPPDEKIVFDACTVTGGEAREVFEYLSHRTMYLDVWDADSLLLLGTVALPLHQFMRQGRAVVQRAFEYDVVAPSGTDEANATVELHSGMPPVGTTIGLLQVATCCYGEQGLGDQPGAASHVPPPKLVPQGALVNWRLATSANAATTSAAGLPIHEDDGAKKRPSVRKRARPLTERGSEVTDALRGVTSNRSSHLSTASRSEPFRPAIATTDDPSAVTYAELLTLSKRFRDETRKGRVMYAGKLLQLLDVPTVAKAEAALVKDLTALEDRGRSLEDLARLLDRHGDGRVRGVDLHEGLQSLCPRTFGRLKLRDAKLLVARIVGDSGVVNLPSLVAWVRQRQSTSGIETKLKELLASAKTTLGVADTAAAFKTHMPTEDGQVISAAHFVSAVRELQSKLRSAQGEASLSPQDKALSDVHLNRFLASWLDAQKHLQLWPLLDRLGLEGANEALEAQGKSNTQSDEGAAAAAAADASGEGAAGGAAAVPTRTELDAMATPDDVQKKPEETEGITSTEVAAAAEPNTNKENNASTNDAASAKASQDDNDEGEGESKVDYSSALLDISQDPPAAGDGASEYVFSTDPSTAALERKLRRVAQSFQARVERSGVGADVEALFSQYDLENTGSILRSELVNVLMQLGLALIDAPPIGGSSSYGGGDAGEGAEGERRRRLAQMAKLKGGIDQRTVRLRTRQPSLLQGEGGNDEGGFGEGGEELALLKWYREGSKKNMVKAMVEAGVKTELHVCPRFATTTFFEQPVANPFSGEERLTVKIDKPHLLRIVTDRDEWQHLRQHVPPPPGFPPLGPGVEEDMVDGPSKQLWVAPHETVHVPLACLLLSPHSDAVPEEGERIVVTFTSVAHGAVVALLHLVLHPRPPVVHRTLRLHAPEGHIVKRTFRVPTATGRYRQPVPLFITTVEGKGQRSALVESQEDHDGALLVALKYSKLGSFPASGDLFVALYSDKWRTSLRELWHVVVSSRLKKDVHACLGTATQAELVVRGDPHHQAPRRVRAYASNQLEVAFSPAGPFHLAPASNLTRVALRWTPLGHPGVRTSSIHLVDVETKQLVAAWQLCAVAAAPTVTTEFEVAVIVGEPGHKKVSYENPWPRAQTYRLRSSDPSRMRPKVERVLVEARGRTYVRLYFAPQERAGTSEVFLLVNDEADQNDECFRIIVNAEH